MICVALSRHRVKNRTRNNTTRQTLNSITPASRRCAATAWGPGRIDANCGVAGVYMDGTRTEGAFLSLVGRCEQVSAWAVWTGKRDQHNYENHFVSIMLVMLVFTKQ